MSPEQAIDEIRPTVQVLARRFAATAPTGLDVDTRDLEQDAYLAALQALPRYNGSTKISTFLRRRMHGSMIDGLRRWDPRPRRSRGPRRVIFEPLDSVDARWAAPHVDPLADHLHAQVMQAVHRLDERAQHILQLYYVDGLTQESVAFVLGISESLAGVLRNKALASLRAVLQ